MSTEEVYVEAQPAPGETTAIPLHPPLPSAGVSAVTERECQKNDRTLATGHQALRLLVDRYKLRSQAELSLKVTSWLTAAIIIENPYCSCKLTHVR